MLRGENQIKQILTERKVLELLKHPFLIKLHWAFQSSKELFFVMDILTGGELFTHLQRQRCFSEKQAKFYMSEILIGFEYLHNKDIVYRDLKPENILVDMDGHILIADFGLTKIIPEPEKSHSFCGSAEYLSPEMLDRSEGHDRRMDIYILGVLLYEMLTGLPPFFDDDPLKMMDNIMTAELVLDQPHLSYEVKNLLAMMLERDPVVRLQSIIEVKSHEWFNDIDWDKASKKGMKPPIVPDINSSYFEPDQGDEDTAETMSCATPGRGNDASQLMTRSCKRRVSYYMHSTINLPSCIDERASFIGRGPSQLRQLFDNSALHTNMNESMLNQNLQTSMLDANRSQLNWLLQYSSPNQNQSDGSNLFLQDLNEVPSSQRITDAFTNFEYICPPKAEVQVLRMLEAHLNRKKKDAQDKYQIKQELIQRRQQRESRQLEESKAAPQRQPMMHFQPAPARNKAYANEASKFVKKRQPVQHGQINQSSSISLDRKQLTQPQSPNIASRVYGEREQTPSKRPSMLVRQSFRTGDIENEADSHYDRHNQPSKMLEPKQFLDFRSSDVRAQRSSGIEGPLDSNSVDRRSQFNFLSDSEIYTGQRMERVQSSSQLNGRSTNNMTVADEYTNNDRGVGERVGNYDDSRQLSSFIAEIPSGGHNLRGTSKQELDLLDTFQSQLLQNGDTSLIKFQKLQESEEKKKMTIGQLPPCGKMTREISKINNRATPHLSTELVNSSQYVSSSSSNSSSNMQSRESRADRRQTTGKFFALGSRSNLGDDKQSACQNQRQEISDADGLQMLESRENSCPSINIQKQESADSENQAKISPQRIDSPKINSNQKLSPDKSGNSPQSRRNNRYKDIIGAATFEMITSQNQDTVPQKVYHAKKKTYTDRSHMMDKKNGGPTSICRKPSHSSLRVEVFQNIMSQKSETNDQISVGNIQSQHPDQTQFFAKKYQSVKLTRAKDNVNIEQDFIKSLKSSPQKLTEFPVRMVHSPTVSPTDKGLEIDTPQLGRVESDAMTFGQKTGKDDAWATESDQYDSPNPLTSTGKKNLHRDSKQLLSFQNSQTQSKALIFSSDLTPVKEKLRKTTKKQSSFTDASNYTQSAGGQNTKSRSSKKGQANKSSLSKKKSTDSVQRSSYKGKKGTRQNSANMTSRKQKEHVKNDYASIPHISVEIMQDLPKDCDSMPSNGLGSKRVTQSQPNLMEDNNKLQKEPQSSVNQQSKMKISNAISELKSLQDYNSNKAPDKMQKFQSQGSTDLKIYAPASTIKKSKTPNKSISGGVKSNINSLIRPTPVQVPIQDNRSFKSSLKNLNSKKASCKASSESRDSSEFCLVAEEQEVFVANEFSQVPTHDIRSFVSQSTSSKNHQILEESKTKISPILKHQNQRTPNLENRRDKKPQQRSNSRSSNNREHAQKSTPSRILKRTQGEASGAQTPNKTAFQKNQNNILSNLLKSPQSSSAATIKLAHAFGNTAYSKVLTSPRKQKLNRQNGSNFQSPVRNRSASSERNKSSRSQPKRQAAQMTAVKIESNGTSSKHYQSNHQKSLGHQKPNSVGKKTPSLVINLQRTRPSEPIKPYNNSTTQAAVNQQPTALITGQWQVKTNSQSNPFEMAADKRASPQKIGGFNRLNMDLPLTRPSAPTTGSGNTLSTTKQKSGDTANSVQSFSQTAKVQLQNALQWGNVKVTPGPGLNKLQDRRTSDFSPKMMKASNSPSSKLKFGRLNKQKSSESLLHPREEPLVNHEANLHRGQTHSQNQHLQEDSRNGMTSLKNRQPIVKLRTEEQMRLTKKHASLMLEPQCSDFKDQEEVINEDNSLDNQPRENKGMLAQKVFTRSPRRSTKLQKDGGGISNSPQRRLVLNKKKSSWMMNIMNVDAMSVCKISLLPSQVTFKDADNSRNMDEVTRSKVSDSDLAIPSSSNSMIGASQQLSRKNSMCTASPTSQHTRQKAYKKGKKQKDRSQDLHNLIQNQTAQLRIPYTYNQDANQATHIIEDVTDSINEGDEKVLSASSQRAAGHKNKLSQGGTNKVIHSRLNYRPGTNTWMTKN